MAIQIDPRISATQLRRKVERMFEASAQKVIDLQKTWEPDKGTPVFTKRGRYTSRGWTEWTQGFQFGSALLQYEATGEKRFLAMGRDNTVKFMALHVSHVGVHDHGFNNISTYGNLLRLIREGRANDADAALCELALKVSGAIQAARWTPTNDGKGYIYSFNGPHSLFIDTMRSLRSLAVAHRLGHVLMGEGDQKISLLKRMLDHGEMTARYAVYYGEGRDAYDVRGRTAHESIFDINNGAYRCPNSQQGYSPFSTWTRGLAWAICGFAEQLEFLATLRGDDAKVAKRSVPAFLRAAKATADFYIENACADGIPIWDTGAPALNNLGAYHNKPADPYNEWEPVDSSAAAIAAQGLMRLGNYLDEHRYRQAALTIANTILCEPYLSVRAKHQGLLLHSIYHRPNGWDYIPRGQKIPNGESSMWGDYHLRELGVLLLLEGSDKKPFSFWDGVSMHGHR